MEFDEALAATAEKPMNDREMIAALEAKGYMVTVDAPTQRLVDLGGGETGKVRFAVTSDNHLGHKHQQLTHLRDFYAKASDFGIDFMLNGGDLVDGQNMHRDQQFELFRHGVDAQARYAIENLPVATRKRKVVPTYGIGGNHDAAGWNDVGANVLQQVQDGREDYRFLGAPTAMFHWGPLKIMLMHPDGGPSYARSYKLQKIVEGFEADTKPHILLCGHWHVQCHVSVRNVEAFALPCFQSQTAYLRRKGLQPVIGGYLFEVEYDERGPLSIAPRFIRYANPVPADFP